MSRTKRKIKHYLTDEQIEVLFASVEKRNKRAITDIKCRNRLAFALMLHCGLRASEVSNLRLIDVREEHEFLRILDSKGNDREVPYDEFTKVRLYEWLEVRGKWASKENPYVMTSASNTNRGGCISKKDENGIIHPRHWTNALYTLSDKTGICFDDGRTVSKVHAHALRTTFATNMIRKGMPLPFLQKILGHENIQTTMEYVHVVNDDAFSEYRRIQNG